MITPAKLRALRLLAGGARLTGKHTTNDLIGGRVARCLMRDGLARPTGTISNHYEITDAGREYLRGVNQTR